MSVWDPCRPRQIFPWKIWCFSCIIVSSGAACLNLVDLIASTVNLFGTCAPAHVKLYILASWEFLQVLTIVNGSSWLMHVPLGLPMALP